MDIFAPCDFWAEGRCGDNREGRKSDLERYQAMGPVVQYAGLSGGAGGGALG